MDLFDWIIFFSAFSSSLLGSLHCLGMCGPLVCAAAPTHKTWWSYQLGRLVGYLFLGFIAGSLGQLFLNSLSRGLLPWLSAFALGGSFILLGLQMYRGKKLVHFPTSPEWLKRRVNQHYGQTIPGSSNTFPIFAMGFFSLFLPCGWLYSYVLASVPLGSPIKAALFLAAFWLGTLPALALGTLFFKKIMNSIRRTAPQAAGLLLITLGLFALSLKLKPLLISSMSENPAQKVISEPQKIICH